MKIRVNPSTRSGFYAKAGACSGLTKGGSPPFVKICGITNLADAQAAVKAGADFLGFIFYAKSPRYVTPQQAKRIISRLPRRVLKVGVFVNEAPARVRSAVASCGCDMVQLHGDEPPAVVRGFAEFPIIKAVRVKSAASLKDLSKYDVDFFLFDAFSSKERGGTGKVFDWKLLKRIEKLKTPYFISGGLTPGNVGEVLKKARPFGVDVSSGVERCPGRKDVRKLRAFVKAVRFSE
jgi:phosphoribosylanthranilate isomerase